MRATMANCRSRFQICLFSWLKWKMKCPSTSVAWCHQLHCHLLINRNLMVVDLCWQRKRTFLVQREWLSSFISDRLTCCWQMPSAKMLIISKLWKLAVFSERIASWRCEAHNEMQSRCFWNASAFERCCFVKNWSPLFLVPFERSSQMSSDDE